MASFELIKMFILTEQWGDMFKSEKTSISRKPRSPCCPKMCKEPRNPQLAPVHRELVKMPNKKTEEQIFSVNGTPIVLHLLLGGDRAIEAMYKKLVGENMAFYISITIERDGNLRVRLSVDTDYDEDGNIINTYGTWCDALFGTVA